MDELDVYFILMIVSSVAIGFGLGFVVGYTA